MINKHFSSKHTIGNYFLSKLHKPLKGESKAEIFIPPDLKIMDYKSPMIKIEDKIEIYYSEQLSKQDLNDIVNYINKKLNGK
jgi:hypothetical protein